ncbi:MAG: ATP-binding cassette domain-containing protein, partial [Ruthenibacterium sp.]
MNAPILQTNNLRLHYGTFLALQGISLTLGEKEITAFIGPSGCGKSTFLKTLNRMNDLVPGIKIEGEVLYRGENTYQNSVDVTNLRKKIGMV